METFHLTSLLILSWITLVNFVVGLPDLRDNSRVPVTVQASEEAVLTCNVKQLENNTVIWKRIKNGRADVLTAGNLRVTSDSRYSVLHTEESSEWMLVIASTRMSDGGQYVCEVNSSPTVRVFMLLIVTAVNSLPLPIATPFALTHNFTDCCIMKNVPELCLGFCSLQNIVLGNTGTTSHECEDHLGNIAFCMADGKNHEPCCIREHIPEACREVCRGEYTLQSASVLHHYACSHYSSATLACIAQGVELLPGPPSDVVLEPISDSEIKVKWNLPADNQDSITHYILNVTELKEFDEMDVTVDVDGPMGEEEEYFPTDGTMPPEKPKIEREGRKKTLVEKFTEIKINGTETSTVLKELKPYTMYEVYLISVNGHGSSLPSYKLRALTLMPKADRPPTAKTNVSLPQLPNIRVCCEKQNVPMENCIDRFCDPLEADDINLTDMMICAPWVSITLPCLTQGRDHTPCCIQRGLPSVCLNLCHGNITRIDYQYFQCLPYMDIFSNCLMEGYGVLASAPKDLSIHHVSAHWAILHWQPPNELAETVNSYTVHYRSLSSDEGEGFYIAIPNTQSPYLLNSLLPNHDYEVFVRAANDYGVSQASARVLFHTDKVRKPIMGQTPSSNPGYNMTECCLQSGVAKACLPLCNFHARLSEVKGLVPTCIEDLHKMLRCGAGGRNHVPCCKERGVHTPCLELCAGAITRSATSVASSCVADLINIVECMEEGTDYLPGPVTDFETLNVNSSVVQLEWKPPKDSNVTGYEVFYEIWKDEASRKSIRVNETSTVITDLDPHNVYAFYVLAVNDYGSSTPSSIVHLNLSYITEGAKKKGAPSAPEALSVREKNITSITLIWLPPAYTHPLDHLRYKLYYQSGNQSFPNSLTTTSLGVQLHDLQPNTEYEIYVTALTDQGESLPAETLSVWTDAAYPAYVEVPHIHPSTSIEEGSNMTVLCVAMGTPIPVVSVFVNGIIYAQQTTRHMVAVIPNVTKEMDTVVCHAENGYGMGMQASKSLQISFAPVIYNPDNVKTTVGQTAMLTCLVTAHPEPLMVWWKDVEGSREIVNGDNHLVRTVQDEMGSYSMHLTIVNVSAEDDGTYYCRAENNYGKATQATNLKVQVLPSFEPSNIRDCCIAQQVIPECMDACTLDVNIEAIVSRSRCIPEIHKLMYCAADGSDHRRCCLGWGVPRRCIGWCQGKAIHHGAMCILVWSKQILSCFVEGKDLLPGPPQNLHVIRINNSAARVMWDPPLKNPHTVDYYKVTWKKTSPGRSIKYHNETHQPEMIIEGMELGATYEFSVKAINRRGSSVPSPILKMIMNGEVGYESFSASNSEQVGLAVGLVIAIIVVGIMAAVIYLHYRRRYVHKSPGGVSFENPSYMKDGTSDAVQISNALESNGGVRSNDGWKSEPLHATEMNSSGHYEELRNETSSGLKHSKEIL